jgi:alkylation response protein AidB-like acyl-CoA dehydrogenase
VFTTRATRDGDTWVINGRKYWSSNASVASFFIVVAITNPDVAVHRGASTFLVPRDTPGLVIETSHHLFGSHPYEPGHALVRYENVRVPADALLGVEGHGFEVAQSRLAGGRLHHAMRAIGVAQRAIDLMAERPRADSPRAPRSPRSSSSRASSPTRTPS